MPDKSPLVILGAYLCSLREAQWLIDHLKANGLEIVERVPVPPMRLQAESRDAALFCDLMKVGR